MSVYIPNMEIPRKRCEAIIFVHKDGSAYIALSPEEGEGGYFREYPLVQVPEHGRLIDGDKVFKRLQKQAMSVWGDGNPRYQIILDVMDAIRFAPTIIPADPADKEEEE